MLAPSMSPLREYRSASIPVNGVTRASAKLLEAITPAIASGELSVASPARIKRAITVNQSPMNEISFATNSRRNGEFLLSHST